MSRKGSFRLVRCARVPAPAHAVFGLLVDLARRPEWLHELTHVDPPGGPIAPGTRFDAESTLFRHRFLGRSELVEVHPGRRLAEDIVVGARLRSEWDLDVSAGGGTRVHHTLVVEVPGGPFNRLERWVLRRRLSRLQRASVEALAALVAPGATQEAPPAARRPAG